MNQLKRYSPGGPAVLRKTDANPEGKGVNGLMLDWYRSEPRGVVTKPRRQVLAEFFTSMLVLSANFKYRPAIGGLNYLYWIDEQWVLSLIAPHEWSQQRQAEYAGTCELQPDMTWTIEPAEQLAEDNPVSAAMRRFYDAFAHMLGTDLTLEELLPTYVGGMRYYQRLYANSLGRSLRASVTMGGQTSTSAREWRAGLPRLSKLLLPLRN